MTKDIKISPCVVVPDIEEITAKAGTKYGRAVQTQVLSLDYNASIPRATIEYKQLYGHCVWESDNDVLDDQIVTLTWDDDFRSVSGKEFTDRGPKTAVFHMATFTEAQCERWGKKSRVHMEKYSTIARRSESTHSTNFCSRKR